ncbi:hypothetical protein K3495_g9453 [Podosphaera aphanis]|nr:hypothetical protein K3495_g9453 [Podosphaera aphanis]
MKCALASHLRKGIAYRQGVSETNYESFAKEVQSLAKELESIPSFRAIRGSDKEYFSFDNTAQATQSTADTNQSIYRTNQSSSSRAGQPAVRYNQDGDVQLADISSLQSQIQAQTQAILAVLKGTNGKPSSGNLRKSDLRPFPPEISQTERNRRINCIQCARCGKSPSHRWGDCKYRNFRENPTPRGYSFSRRAGVNWIAKETPTNEFVSDSEN